MASDCCGSGETILLYPCSGASNVGQVTHELAVQLSLEGRGSMSCLAGVGAHLSGFVLSARECDRAVVIDGCAQGCAGRIFEHLDIQPQVHIVLTGEGFKKKIGQRWTPEDVAGARDLLLERMETPT